MKIAGSEKGIALITALLFTFLTLAIVSGLIYVITQNTKSIGSHKIYMNAVEASYGGVDMMTGEILPELFNKKEFDSIVDSLEAKQEGIGLEFLSTDKCIEAKLSKKTDEWGALCPDHAADLDVNENPDLKFKLKGTSNQQFAVTAKIVDTIPGIPYINDLPSSPLRGGHGVVSLNGGGGVRNKYKHYLYRMEIASQKESNSKEKAAVTAIYEY